MNRSIGLVGDVIRTASIAAVQLAFKDRRLLREYLSTSLRQYDELAGHGLPAKNPLSFMYKEHWAPPRLDQRVVLPPTLETDGGTRVDELFLLATVTCVLRPSKIFEIGTFMGRTTSAFVLNAPSDATVVTLDLPEDVDGGGEDVTGYIDTDVLLVKQRRVGSFLRRLGLTGRYEQIYGDSMEFDPAPHAGTVELGFIDGAHAREYVENDTRKMAVMMAERGLVFWHDYGGKGRFRELTQYLDALAGRIPIYRVPNMSLAWTPASSLRTIAAELVA